MYLINLKNICFKHIEAYKIHYKLWKFINDDLERLGEKIH